MSSAIGQLTERFNAMPRSGKWLTGFVVFMGLYFLAIEPAVSAIQRWNEEADKIESRVTNASSTADRLERQRPDLDRAMTSLGELKANPKESKAAKDALDKRWNEILKKYSGTLSEKRRTARAEDFQQSKNAAQARALGFESRIGYDVTLDCDTPTLMNMLRDLESSPDVHAITQLTINKDSSRSGEHILNVSLRFETWSSSRLSAGEGR